MRIGRKTEIERTRSSRDPIAGDTKSRNPVRNDRNVRNRFRSNHDAGAPRLHWSLLASLLASAFLTGCGSEGTPVSELPEPGAIDPLPGQVIVDPDNPRWFRYAGGGPFFLCGPGDPEGFLYRGTRLPDGTRDGDQMELIQKIAASGANGIYMQIIRSHGGDGEADHNPFVDSDPGKGLDEDILSQWDTWFAAMDDAGIVPFLFLYDDSACIWNCDPESNRGVLDEERILVETLVRRYRDLKHLIWVVAEEYQERFHPERVSALAKLIRAADGRGHPVAVHKLVGMEFSELADDSYVDQFAVQAPATDPHTLHQRLVQAFRAADGRYNLNMAEMPEHGAGRGARARNWAAAMAGAYVMVYLWDIATTDPEDLRGCGILRRFFESTRFDRLVPRDDLAAAETKYVLGPGPHAGSDPEAAPGPGATSGPGTASTPGAASDPGSADDSESGSDPESSDDPEATDTSSYQEFILYAAAADRGTDRRLGVTSIAPGRYDLSWVDPATGVEVETQSVVGDEGEASWPIPRSFGPETAVWIRPAGR